MTYTSKYEIGETVWLLHDSELIQRQIQGVDIHHGINQMGDAKAFVVSYYFKEGLSSSRPLRAHESLVAKNRNVILKRLLLDSEE